MESDMRIYSLGVARVGKSTMSIRYFFDVFEEEWERIASYYLRKQVTVNGLNVTLDMVDYCENDEFIPLEALYARAEGFCVFFSLTDRNSYEQVPAKIAQMKDVLDRTHSHRIRAGTEVPMVLIATKAELVAQQVVSTEEGEELAKKYRIPFIVTSAKTGENVEKAFLELARLIMEYRSLHPPKVIKRKSECELM